MILATLHAVFYCAVGLVLLTLGGNQACKRVLQWSGLTQAKEAPPPAPGSQTPPPVQASPVQTPPRVGRLIGSFERLLIAAAILAGSWEILAAVVALKTVARFKELDQKLDAEYFLVGSLFSVAWAMGVTWLWIAYDRCVGEGLAAYLAGPH